MDTGLRTQGRKGQASLEMTAALIGALLLLFGSLKVCLYFAERLVTRWQNYEGPVGETRVLAANVVRPPPPFQQLPPLLPDSPQPLNKPMNKLDIFKGDN